MRKAAALLQSLAKNHGLVDGNNRLALIGCKAMLNINGWQVVADDNTLYHVVIDVASGHLDEVEKIADELRDVTRRFDFPPDLI